MPEPATATAPPDDDPHPRDLRQLRWLAWGHYAVAVATACLAWSGYRLAEDGYRIMLRADQPLPEAYGSLASPPGPGVDPTDYRATVGLALLIAGGVLATLGVVHAGALALVGRWIARRRRRTLCLVFSFFDLTYIPIGLVLSVFSLLVLYRPTVVELFQRSQP